MAALVVARRPAKFPHQKSLNSMPFWKTRPESRDRKVAVPAALGTAGVVPPDPGSQRHFATLSAIRVVPPATTAVRCPDAASGVNSSAAVNPQLLRMYR